MAGWSGLLTGLPPFITAGSLVLLLGGTAALGTVSPTSCNDGSRYMATGGEEDRAERQVRRWSNSSILALQHLHVASLLSLYIYIKKTISRLAEELIHLSQTEKSVSLFSTPQPLVCSCIAVLAGHFNSVFRGREAIRLEADESDGGVCRTTHS